MQLPSSETNAVTSVRFSPDGSQLAVGCMSDDCASEVRPVLVRGSHSLFARQILLYDVASQKRVQRLTGHTMRVGSLAWNGRFLSSGSRDCSILHHDPRLSVNAHRAGGLDQPSSIVATLHGHREEICGLRWSPDGQQLASGANINHATVWDRSSLSVPRLTIEHKAQHLYGCLAALNMR